MSQDLRKWKSMEVLWSKCLEDIVNQVLPENYNTWFTPTSPISYDGQVFTLGVPNEFFKKYLKENYQNIIENSLESVSGTPLRVKFKVYSARNGTKVSYEKHTYIETDEQDRLDFKPSLNQKYTFKNFVVGGCNQFAHAAAKAVASNPAMAYNPLFIYGSVGLGKTHLLHAIGNAIHERNKKLKIRYVSTEGFTIDLIQSLKKDGMNAFRDRYRPLDVLLVDDIQFIEGKDRTQEEFFYTFNSLFEAHKQVIITSDAIPKEMRKIQERLRSRFECGLIADMEPPDLETKVAILLKKAEIQDIKLSEDVAIYIANNIRLNIRELEGILLRLIAYSSFTSKPINMDLAKNVFKKFSQDNQENFTIQNILKQVATHYNLKVSDLKSKKRSRDISVPRQIAMFLCRERTKSSLPEIGREFGGKDHTTVIYSHTKIGKLLKENNEISRSVQTLIEKIERG